MAVPLSPCLRRHGIATNQAPKDASDTTQGPADLPITRQQLRVVCVDAQGSDCTRLVRGAYSLGLGWQVVTDTYSPAHQMFSSVNGDRRSKTSSSSNAHIAGQGVAASEASLQAMGLAQPSRALPGLGYLYSAQVQDF